MKSIRNFSIIAHIDHGKSTLADRMIQYSGVVEARNFKDQILDTMDIERERGITIKSQAITLPYRSTDGREYSLNLIDTPGHVDFSYEVSRSLASCEGVLLLIDAVQGVQAQTVANLYMAMEHDLEIIPVINKIDLPSADVERVMEQIDAELGLDPYSSLPCSAKEGTGVLEIMEAIVRRIPPPKGNPEAELAAIIFDAQYDPFQGTIIHCRIVDGTVRSGEVIRLMHSGTIHKVEEVGHFLLSRQRDDSLSAGDVGYIIAGIKTVSDVRIGDTITTDRRPCAKPLPGFKESKPVVFASIYPIASDDYEDLAVGLEKYTLNDASFIYQKDSSVALGQGFRCGFLGLLHLERDRPGAAGAGVRPLHYPFRSQRPVPLHTERRRSRLHRQPGSLPRRLINRQERGAVYTGLPDLSGTVHGGGHETVQGKEGRELESYLSQSWAHRTRNRDAAGRGHIRFL